MSYQVLARKYRPQKFSEVIGQEHVTRTLKNAIEQGRTAHGYIFSGHRGIGKTTVARILAMALNCRSSDRPASDPCGECDSCREIRSGSSVDVMEIDAATNRGIDEIRELREAARYRPARDRFKIYILDEAHQITDAAFNALLKTLEEPPDHVVFMLATTQPEDIPQTIRSRCQHFAFRAVRFEQIVEQLREVCRQESIVADENALALLAEAADGSMRDALSLLDQAIATGGGSLAEPSVRQLIGSAPAAALEEIMRAVERGSSQELLEKLAQLLDEGQSPAHLARQFVGFLRNALVAKVAGSGSSLLEISPDERARVSRVAERFTEEDLARYFAIMLRTHGELSYRQEQRLYLELGLLKLALAARMLPLEELLSVVEISGGTVPESAPAARAEPGRAGVGNSLRPLLSPFAADSARKTTPRGESAEEPAGVRPSPPQVILGTAAPAVAAQGEPELEPRANAGVEAVRAAALRRLRRADQTVLASMLESGEWKLAEDHLLISLAGSPTMIEMLMSGEARGLILSSVRETLGRSVKLEITPATLRQSRRSSPLPANGGGRGRAEREPVVQRMKEKFGAEIRTVIDYREKS